MNFIDKHIYDASNLALKLFRLDELITCSGSAFQSVTILGSYLLDGKSHFLV